MIFLEILPTNFHRAIDTHLVEVLQHDLADITVIRLHKCFQKVGCGDQDDEKNTLGDSGCCFISTVWNFPGFIF